MTRARAAPAAVAIALVLLSGCKGNVSVGIPTSVPTSEVESEVANQMVAQVHLTRPTVRCPGPLPAKVGATLSCTLQAQGSPDLYPVTVTVTSVNGGDVRFRAQVGPNPITATSTT